MNDLVVFALHNSVVAIVLALIVYGSTRVWRNPPVAHLLWLLVLLKLVAPPVGRVEWPAHWLLGSLPAQSALAPVRQPRESWNVDAHSRLVARTTSDASAPASAPIANEYDFATTIFQLWNRARPTLLCVWLGGAVACALIAVTRIVRFERQLRNTLPASGRVRRTTADVAGKLGVRRVPDVRFAAGVKVPMLWWAGRGATIVLPMRLIAPLDREQLALVLAHELAHLRRRDHWVRACELAVSMIYWWNPLVGLIRRQLHQTEDICCDAWVRWAFPTSTTRYAEVLLEAAESLGASDVGVRLLPSSALLSSLSLKARITMILESRFVPFPSKKSLIVIGGLAALLLPSFVPTTRGQTRAAADDEASTASEATSSATSEFPHAVKFEQGATQFLDGDKITIVEVRGTAETFAPGNIYWIRGKYTLGSSDRAMVAAYTTAMDAANGTSGSLKVQTTVVNRGDGTFTLFLPMSYRGWPHVSFYPAEGGSGFGGNYFGTGDSVLKKWWGSKDKDTELDPVASDAYLGRASANSRLGRVDAAWRDLQRAEQLGAEVDPEIRRALAEAAGSRPRKSPRLRSETEP